jgi:DNA-binding beta-propeller fold protein YncE
VAISLRAPTEAVVLQNDDAVRLYDLAKWGNPSTAFVIPADFQGMDLAAGTFKGLPVMCLVVNRRPGGGKPAESYLLQVIDGKQVWTLLQPQGIYVGAAFDPEHGIAYVSNATTNQIFQVTVGQAKQRPREVRRIVENVVRIGPVAVDVQRQRVFTADVSGRVFVVALADRTVRTIDTPGLEDIRAIAWHPGTERLLVADSGSEAVWSVGVDRGAPKPQVVLRDRRFRQPSGVTVSPSGSIWLTDERSGAVVGVLPDGRIGRTATAPPAVKKF